MPTPRTEISCYILSEEIAATQRDMSVPYNAINSIAAIRTSLETSIRIPSLDLHLFKPKDFFPLEPADTLFDRIESSFLRDDGSVEEIKIQRDHQSRYFSSQLLPEEEAQPYYDIFVITTQDLEGLKPVQNLPQDLRSRYKALKERTKTLNGSVVAPSTAAEKPLHFKDERLMAGRPIQRYSLPTALYNPELAKITQRFDDIDEVQVTDEMVRHAAELVSIGAKFFKEEKDRANALQEPLNTIFGPAAYRQPVNEGGAIPDAVWGLAMIGEFKNEKGLKGNAQLQGFFSRLHIIQGTKKNGQFPTSNFPCIILSISSTLFEVSLTVMTDVLLVDDVFRMDTHSGRHLQGDTVTLARALTVVCDGVKDLKSYYHRLQIPASADNRADYLFPNPVCLNLQTPSYGPLTFLERLSSSAAFPATDIAEDQSTAKRLELSMTLFTARMPNNTVVMVKFTPIYNPQAHALLATEQLAPTLFYCTKVAGGWWMVVMDYMDKARNAYTYLYNHPDTPLPRCVYHDVRKALEILHAKNLVFGDVRLQNVLVQDSGDRLRGYLVDFDWCGEEGQARYPVFMSELEIYRDAGMLPYGKMSIHHDRDLLTAFEKYCVRE